MINYRESIFNQPGQSGFFSRTFFYSFNGLLAKFLTGDDLTAFKRSILLLIALMFFALILIAATVADPFLIFYHDEYERPSEIYARDGEGNFRPIAEFYRFSRRVIRLNDSEFNGLNAKVARAFIVTEDNNFTIHLGIDFQGILRAAVVNLMAGKIKEGASTITQQAARLRFLTSTRSMGRKLREAFLAFLLELKYSKEKIMEIYLNEVPLGHGTIGVEAAAKFYFNKKAANLNWGEAALLSSLTTRPRDFSPLRNIRESQRKVSVVFKKFIENGIMSVSSAEVEYDKLQLNYYRNLNRSPNDSAFNRRLNQHPYVTAYIKYSLPSKYRRNYYKKLYTGGLRIYTTIEIEHQKAAEQTFIPYLLELTRKRSMRPFKHFDQFDKELGAVYNVTRLFFDLPAFRIKMKREERKFQRAFIQDLRSELLLLNKFSGLGRISSAIEYHLQKQKKYMGQKKGVEGSLISMRPNTGAITAVIGGSDFSAKNRYLRFIMARRPPGSSFKPILYASGIEYSGRNPGLKQTDILTAATVVDDSPQHFVNRDLSEYSPENYTLSYEGPVRLRKGLALSKNAVAIKVYEQMGWRKINPIAEELLYLDQKKPRRNLRHDVTVALGTHEVSPFIMARTFNIFASGGKSVDPYVLLYITDSRGKIIDDFRPDQAKKEANRRVIIKPGTAQIITSMLMDAVRTGTGRGAFIPGRFVAGKTGTTNRYRDAWFVGFTPLLVTALHIGYDRGKALGPRGTGGAMAAPIWRRYMTAALIREKPGRFHYPASRVIHARICEISGKKPGKRCKKTIVEMFLPGTIPEEICNEHGGPGQVDSPQRIESDDEILQGDR